MNPDKTASIESNARPRGHGLPSFLWGAAYYPEHGDIETIDSDIERMGAAGMNVVRMAEFAWDLMEPEEGVFNFSLFDKAITKLAKGGITTILCTPTAAPPRWLTVKHPEICRVDSKGVVQCHGSRQHASTANDLFRSYSKKITSAMADHFKDNPAVIGWQTDNELNCHFSEDYSPGALLAWTRFLRAKFQDNIGTLNRAWGTAFWAQTYSRFEEVPFPARNQPTHLNPAHHLDYFRFIAHTVAAFQRDQVAILRASIPGWFLMHNGLFRLVDYHGMFSEDLDILGFDVYPMFEKNAKARGASQAWNLDYTRAFKGNFIVPEHQSGPGGQTDYFHDNPEPGELRRMLYSTLARGAEGILLFRWRSARFGAEEYWTGVLDHDNVPRRRYQEVSRTGLEFSRIGREILGTQVRADVAVAAGDFDNIFGHEALHLGLPGPDQVAAEVHSQFWRAGYAVKVHHPALSLAQTRLFVVPHLSLFKEQWVAELASWVERGGVLVIGARSGTKDRDNNVVGQLLPGVLRSLTGCTVVEYGRQNVSDRPPHTFEMRGRVVHSSDWYEQLDPDMGTETWLRWTSRHLAGSAAATLRKRGLGMVIYVGTYLTKDTINALVPELATIARLKPMATHLRPDVETVLRDAEDVEYEFILNHADEPREIFVQDGFDLVREHALGGSLWLAARDVAVIRRQTR